MGYAEGHVDSKREELMSVNKNGACVLPYRI